MPSWLRARFGDDEDSYIQLYNRTEYRAALAYKLFGRGNYRLAPGEFILEQHWRDGLVWEERNSGRVVTATPGSRCGALAVRPAPSTMF